MNELDFTFEQSPWELLLENLRSGSTISAVRLLNALEGEDEEALEDALQGYGGTMFVISHDRYLINQMATRIIALTRDGVTEYIGNYEDYVKAVKAAAEQ